MATSAATNRLWPAAAPAANRKAGVPKCAAAVVSACRAPDRTRPPRAPIPPAPAEPEIDALRAPATADEGDLKRGRHCPGFWYRNRKTKSSLTRALRRGRGGLLRRDPFQLGGADDVAAETGLLGRTAVSHRRLQPPCQGLQPILDLINPPKRRGIIDTRFVRNFERKLLGSPAGGVFTTSRVSLGSECAVTFHMYSTCTFHLARKALALAED